MLFQNAFKLRLVADIATHGLDPKQRVVANDVNRKTTLMDKANHISASYE